MRPEAPFDHWVAYDIEPVGEIPEDVGEIGVSGRNSAGELGYVGPCPPSGTHRYFFRVYALDTRLGLEEGATKSQVLDAARDHVLAEATLMGTYSRDG
jgi:phospholipid-binding protein, PBP family